MAIESTVVVRRVARLACLVLIFGLLLSSAATAQLPTSGPVPVTVGSIVPFGHGSTGTWSQIYSIKFAPNGNLLFMDSAISNIYQLAPGSTTPTLVVGPVANGGSSNCSSLEPSGSYWNAAIAIDASNTLYVTDRYGSAVHFCRVPYDAASGTWIFGSATNWVNGPQITVGGVSTAVSPQDIAIGDDGTFYVSWSDTGEIDKFTVDASGNASAVTRVITGMETFASNIAVDHAGNLFFLEDVYDAPGSRVTGVREIPANATLPLTGDATGTLEASLTRIDPAAEGLNGIKGMTFDPAGNLFLSLANNSSYGGSVSGVIMVPNEGTPTAPNLAFADVVMISPVYAGFPIAIDPRGYLWIPTGGSGNWAPPGTLAATCVTTDNTTINATCTSSSMVLWAVGSANLGSSPVGTPGTAQSVYYSFTQPITPGSFSFAQPGAKNFAATVNPNPDPSANPAVAPCTAGTAYPGFSGQETDIAEYSWCVVYAQLTPQSAGSISGELQILDSSNNIVEGSNAYLNGIGQGSAVSILSTPLQNVTAKGLNKPLQVAADLWGNTYVADSGLKAIEKYPAGSSSVVGSAYGKNLTSPTGVAVDGSGDLYIGDSGKVIEIPLINGTLATSQQTTLLTGLGNHLNLAADGSGNVFVADADKAQVVKITNPGAQLTLQGQPVYTLGNGVKWSAPSAIATDNSGDVFVADGSNLWELTPFGGANAITNSLPTPVTGLAIDPSGSVFVAGATGLIWIPYESSTGGLDVNGEIVVVSGLGSNSLVPFSVALDGSQNAYVTYGASSTAGLVQLGVAGSINYGQIVPLEEFDQEAEIVNLGNTPLTFSAFSGDVFTGTNAGDYSVGTPGDSPACSSSAPTPAGGACFFDVALTPSAAGPSSASLSVLTNAANAAAVTIALAANAVPDLRNATQASINVSPASGVVYPGTETISVTVNSVTASNGTPTGSVTLSVSDHAKQTQPLVNGVATFTYTNLLGGTYNVSADYGGAGVAGTSPDFAVSASKSSFTIVTAKPTVAVAAPSGSSTNITVWAGNTYLQLATPNTITASVTSSVGTPTGTVSFMQNGTPVDPTQATIPLDANGNATFSTANLVEGVYNLSVVYNGDVNYSVVTMPIPTFQVIVPAVQITASPATTTITPGTPDQVTLTLKPLVGFVANVDVQCVASTLPQYSECTFDNPEIAVGSGTPATAPSTIVVTISTNVPVNGGASSSIARQAPWSLAGIFGLGLVGLVAGRKRFNRYLMMVFLGLMLSGAFMGITACTNAGYSTPPPAPKVTTPGGTYNIQIITVNPSNGQQNSLTTTPFILTTTVN